MNENDEKKLLEGLSKLEHQQWVFWAKHILKTEQISEQTISRWEKNFVEYEKLSEEVKSLDRPFAQKSLALFKKYLKNRKQ